MNDENLKNFMGENFPNISDKSPNKRWSVEEIDRLLAGDKKQDSKVDDTDIKKIEINFEDFSDSEKIKRDEKLNVEPTDLIEKSHEDKNFQKDIEIDSEELIEKYTEKQTFKSDKNQDDFEKRDIFFAKHPDKFYNDEKEFTDTVENIPEFETKETQVEEKPSFVKKIKLFFNKNNKNSDFIESQADVSPDYEEPESKTDISENGPSVMVSFASKTVGLPPIRNDKIDHNILDSKIEQTDSSKQSYRERFMNVPKRNLPNTEEFAREHSEQDALVERPGMIIKKSKFNKTADLEPLPTIIAAEQATPIDKIQEPLNIEGQMKLEGFDNEEKIEQLDEEKEELNLREKRQKKVENFKLNSEIEKIGEKTSEEETGEEILDDTVDLSKGNNDIQSVLDKYILSDKIAVISTLALFIISLISTIMATFTLENVLIHLIINIVTIVLSSAFSYKVILTGITGLISKRPNLATVINLAIVLNLTQLIILCFNFQDAINMYPFYASESIFMLFVYNISTYFVDKRAYSNFDFLNSGSELYASTVLRNPDDAFELGRGLLIGEPAIYYSSKIKKVSNFMKNSFGGNPVDKISKIIVPIVTVLSLVIFATVSVVFKSLLSGLTAMNAFLMMSVPAFAILLFGLPLYIENKKLNAKGAMIAGHPSIQKSITANAVCLDANDLFRADSCSIVGIKLFNNMRIDDAILYAAAMVIESKGPLKGVFDGVILGKHELLPPVEGLAYEDKLGLSAWIHRRRVLFGSSELLKNHSVEALSDNEEKMYLRKGRKIIYLAIAGKISAMFVVTYAKDPDVAKQLHIIEQTGVPILISSCDFNINEQLICQKFRLQSSSIRVLNSVSGSIFNKYRNTVKEECDSGIVHDGTLENFASTFYNSVMLHDINSMSKQISMVYLAIACILFVILSILQSNPMIAGLEILLFQILWTVISAVMTVIKTIRK